MRKVIKEVPSDTVCVKNASDRKYYGFSAQGDSSHVGFIGQAQWEGGEFIPFCCDGVTHGNQWSDKRASTIEATIENILSMVGKFTVYEFDTAGELFAWVAKEIEVKNRERSERIKKTR